MELWRILWDAGLVATRAECKRMIWHGYITIDDKVPENESVVVTYGLIKCKRGNGVQEIYVNL
jgi:ribosomal protein S4